MHLCGSIYRAAEHVSSGKAAAIGGAGSGVSIASATLAQGLAPLVTPEQSAGTIALLDALYRSAKLGHEVEVRGFASPA